MERTEIIAAIEKVREQPGCADELSELAELLKRYSSNDQFRREQLNADFQRAFLFLFLLMLPDRRLPKKAQREFLRPNRRSILIWICMLGVVVVQVLLLTKGAEAIGLGQAGGVVLLVLFVVEFFWVVWFVTKIQPREGLTEHGTQYRCVACDYDLSGLRSVLGEDLWVGAAVCPECGLEYPAIGK